MSLRDKAKRYHSLNLQKERSSIKKAYVTTFSIIVITRILLTLQEYGPIKRTNLAGKTGLNYTACIRYINLLEKLLWIEIISDNYQSITITQKGEEVMKLLADLL